MPKTASKNVNPKAAKKTTLKAVKKAAAPKKAKAAAKKPAARAGAKPAKPAKKTTKNAATVSVAKKPAAKGGPKKSVAKPKKKAAAKTPTKKVAKKTAQAKSRASSARQASAQVANIAETSQKLNEMLAHATPTPHSSEPAPQHSAAAATLVSGDDSEPFATDGLGAAVSSTGIEDDTTESGDDEDRDDASFNDSTVYEAEPTARRVYNDDGSPFPVQIARLLHDDKCSDIVVLNLKGVNPMWDHVIIGSGTSDRQMRSVLTHVCELGRTMGHEVFRRNADERATWLLADFSDVIVHLFEPNTRAHYDLEMLWGDAQRVEWERPEELPRNRAGLRAGDGL